jgi:secreted PhoX family phosphatase
VFEVDPSSQEANLNKSAVPLRFLGRYAHEAVAVDPRTHTIYETEDAGGPNGLYYRWTPPAGFEGGKGALRKLALSEGGDTAGRLRAMRCSKRSKHIPDLSLATAPGTRYKVEWKDVPDRDATTVSVRKQFTDAEITRSRKLEGQWWADGGAYFVASFARTSDGGANERGRQGAVRQHPVARPRVRHYRPVGPSRQRACLTVAPRHPSTARRLDG